MSRAYLDHASTSPPRPEVVEAMVAWLGAADPGRVHTEGRMARAAVEEAREQVAHLLGARPREVVFTSGGTEAVNAAVFGALALAADRHGDGSGGAGRACGAGGSGGAGGAIVLPAVEHSAVRDASARHSCTVVGVDREGRVDAGALAAAVDDRTALVHCQWGNHEVATLQPVAAVVAAARERGVLVHVDAAAAAGHVAIAFDELGADLLSVSAHKLGGPKGVGALLVRRGLRVPPLLVGGEQERARRAGMEDVAAIVGFGAAAATLAAGAREEEATRNRCQTARLLAGACALDGVVPFGPGADGDRLPHIACLGVAGVEAEAVLLGLDQAGVAAHSGSACSSESLEPSPVLEAMGVEAERSLRASVGWSTTEADVDAFLEALPGVVSRLRALAG